MREILYTPWEIEDCVMDTSEHFNQLYNAENEHEVVFAPILTGVVPFFNDVCKGLMFDPYVEYIGINSYQGAEQKEFNLYKMFDPKVIKGKTVWLFDDIADSGNTLNFLTSMLKQYGAKEVKSCVLIKKAHCAHPIDVCGFTMTEDHFIFGYGMDGVDGRGRSLNTILYENNSIDNEAVI